jgi:hypothetical protein
MWEERRYKQELKRDFKEHRKTEEAYRIEVSNARRDRKKADEVREIEERGRWELELQSDAITWATSRHLSRQAFLNQIPLPPMGDDNWMESRQLGITFLSAKGAAKVRADLRAEQKAKWDLFQSHAGLVISLTASLTGVLGAAIGVLSFMKAPPPH